MRQKYYWTTPAPEEPEKETSESSIFEQIIPKPAWMQDVAPQPTTAPPPLENVLEKILGVGTKALEIASKALEYGLYPITAVGMALWHGEEVAMEEVARGTAVAIKATPEQRLEGMPGYIPSLVEKQISVKDFLPGGGKYQEYQKLPLKKQLLYEAPAWAVAALLIPSATALRTGLAAPAKVGGVKGAAAIATRGALAPLAAYETGIGRITGGIANKVLSVAQQRAVGIALRKEATRLGIKLTTETEKTLIAAYRTKFEQHLNRELVSWMAKNPGVEITEKAQSRVIAFLLKRASPGKAAEMMMVALKGGTTAPLVASAADRMALTVARLVPVALSEGVVPAVTRGVAPSVTGITPTVTGIVPKVSGVTAGLETVTGAPGVTTTAAVTGQPFTATVYRGTQTGVAPTDEGLVGKAEYWSTDPEYAATYGTVTESTVALNNPLVIKTQSEWDAFAMRTRGLRDTAVAEGKSEDWVQTELRNQLEAEGYDGVVVGEGIVERGAQVAVFHPETATTREFVPTTAMAEWDTVTGKPVTPEVTKVTKEVTPVVPEPIDSVIGRLTDAIRVAGPARTETELLKTAELGRRVPKMREAALAAKAEEAGFAAMGQLRGELPTAQFVPPTTVLTEGDVRGLYEHIREQVLRTKGDAFKWLHTDAALRKLLAGNIPTRSELTLLEDVFGSELVGAILAKRPLSEKILVNILDVLNIPRAILASFDFSAWLRQGAFIVTGYPKIGARALAVDLKTFFSGKYAAEIDQFIRNGEYAALREKAKLYLAPTGETVTAKLSQLEETFMSHLVKKIPIIGTGVKWSERAYISTLNYMRAMTFDRYAAMWEGQNYPLETYKQLAALINWATGRGPVGKAASLTPALNAVFFSTRLQTSRAAMLFGGAKFTSPPVRKAYARMMLMFFGTMGSIVALGEIVGLWKTETDPRSSDFGKIRIGNTRLDPWAGFQPIMRLIAQLITGERKTATGRVQDIGRMETLERFFRSKASPAFGLAWDMVEGETFIGEALSLEAEGVGEQVYQRLTPLFIQDLIDAIKEEGWIGGFIAIPAAFGVGAVTYPGSLDAYERHIPEIPSDMLLDWQKGIQMGGGRLAYENLNVLQKAWLRRHCESIGDTPERKEVGSYNFYEAQSETYEEFEVLLNEELQDVVTAYQTGEISLSDYIEQSEYTRNKYFGQASRLWLDAMREKLDPLLHKNLERWHEEEIKPEDAAYEEYMILRANPPKVSGVPDWDAWDKALSKFLDGQTEESKNYIEKRRVDWINNLPEDRQPIERLVLDCESILDDYYAIEPDKRMAYRDRHPEVDARLIILRGLKPRSGLAVAQSLLRKYGITGATESGGPYQWTTPPEEPTEPQQWGVPEEPPAEPTEPKYKWTP